MTRILRTLFGVYSMTVLVIVLLLIFCPLLIVAPTLPLRRAIGRFGVRTYRARLRWDNVCVEELVREK